MTATHASSRPDTVRATYLRHPLVISERDVTVYSPAGVRVGVVRSVREARLFVRGYRRAERAEA